MTQRYVFGGPIHPIVALLLTFLCSFLFAIRVMFTHSVGLGFLVLLAGLYVSGAVYIVVEMWFMPPDDERCDEYTEALEYDDLSVPWWYRWP